MHWVICWWNYNQQILLPGLDTLRFSNTIHITYIKNSANASAIAMGSDDQNIVPQDNPSKTRGKTENIRQAVFATIQEAERWPNKWAPDYDFGRLRDCVIRSLEAKQWGTQTLRKQACWFQTSSNPSRIRPEIAQVQEGWSFVKTKQGARPFR